MHSGPFGRGATGESIDRPCAEPVLRDSEALGPQNISQTILVWGRIADIASALQVREGKIKTRLYRTREKLKGYLEQEGIDL